MMINDIVSDKYDHTRTGIIGAVEVSGRYEVQSVFVQWDDGTECWVLKQDLFVSLEEQNGTI